MDAEVLSTLVVRQLIHGGPRCHLFETKAFQRAWPLLLLWLLSRRWLLPVGKIMLIRYAALLDFDLT